MGDIYSDVRYEGFENGTAVNPTTKVAPLRFRGKVAFWWYAISVIMLICTCCLLATCIWGIVTFSPGAIISIIIASVFLPLLLLDVFMIDSCIRNYVDLNDSFLKIRFSVFSGTIPYSAISSIKETNSLRASFSTSLDRLQIQYMNNKDILVAVKDKNGFLNEMLRRNPGIYIERNGGKTS